MRKSLTTKLVAMFLVLNLAVFSTFLVLLAVLSSSAEEKTAEEYMEVMLSDKSETLEMHLKSVENEASDFANIVSDYRNVDTSGFEQNYLRNSDGVLEGKSMESSAYLPKGAMLTESVKNEIVGTESLVSMMRNVSRNNDGATTYITTESGFLRVYPYLDNTVFDPEHDQKSDPFYMIANEENNPEGEVRWTKPYYDYAGNGWIITCSCPYYIDGDFSGVVSVDLPLETLYGTLQSFQMGKAGYAFAIDYSGNVIYHPEMKTSGIKSGEIYKTSYVDIYPDNPNRQSVVNQMMDREEGYATIFEDGEKKVIAYKKLDYIDWIIGIEVNSSELSSSNLFLPAGVWLSLILSCIIILLIGWIVSRKITTPIVKLTSEVSELDEDQLSKVGVYTDDEIGVLAKAFNNMVDKINQNTNSLVASNNRLESVFSTVNDTLMLIDENLTIIKCNSTAEAGIKCYKLLHNQNEPCRNCPIEMLKQQEVSSQERKTVITDNMIYEVNAYKVIEGSADNLKRQYVVTEVDQTQNYLMEKELMQNEKMAEVGRLVAGLTHELKNPLSVIKGCSYLLKTSDADSEEIVNEIDESVSRANSIVMNMLNFSRKDYDENKVHDVRDHINQIMMLLREDIVEKKINYDIIDLDGVMSI